MATDTARVKLELASGRSEITAPFHQTAQRRRTQPEQTAAAPTPPEPPAPTDLVVIDVPIAEAPPLSAAPAIQPAVAERWRGIGRPTWIAFIAGLLIVGGAVWWVMSQRLPDVDVQGIIQRNLIDAQQAMADGRYTDPSERSALHYYSTVLALDPSNMDAVAGIDAIADRHLTDARVLLAEQRVAEAGVALEKARRVRPHHSGLAVLDAQLRVEVRKILASSSAVNIKPVEEMVEQTAKPPASNARPRTARAQPTPPAKTEAPPAAKVASKSSGQSASIDSTRSESTRIEPAIAAPAPKVTNELPKVAMPTNASSLPGALATTNQASTPESTQAATPGSGPRVEEAAPIAATPTPSPVPERAPEAAAPASEPKLIKMVQPQYPPEALMRGMEGWVEVSLDVTAAGDVVAPRVEETSRGRLFNRAALVAVQQWKYEPREGAATERVRVRLQFKQPK